MKCHQRYGGGNRAVCVCEERSVVRGVEGNMKSNSKKQKHNAAQPTLDKQTDLNIYSAPTLLPSDP